MDRQTKKREGTIPRLLRQAIIQDYLSGRKSSSYMLSIEHGVDQKNINKMGHRYQQKNGIILAQSITTPIMGRKKKQLENLSLKLGNEKLRRQLKLAQLKLEGYQIMGDILQEEYGIDLLKKSESKQSSDSKDDTQK